MDDYIFRLEEENIELKEQNEILNKEMSKCIDEQFRNTWNNIGNTINAIIGTPKLDTVSASILDKIKNMDSIEEVKDYIDVVFKSNLK